MQLGKYGNLPINGIAFVIEYLLPKPPAQALPLLADILTATDGSAAKSPLSPLQTGITSG
jgi:hypothetical protein